MASLSPKTSVLSRVQAAHLLRRLTIGPTREQIDLFTGMTIEAALNLLLVVPSTYPGGFNDPLTGDKLWQSQALTASNSQDFELIIYNRVWWANLLRQDNTALEKMVLFLHIHFTTQAEAVPRANAVSQQNQLLRRYAFGNFKVLTKKICRDIAMQEFLNGTTNTVSAPNENYARELLELYTIGKGPQIAEGNYTTYTEADIAAAARVLTGYRMDWNYVETDTDTGFLRTIINKWLHDTGDKTFSAAFQNTVITGRTEVEDIGEELDELIDLIFAQDATALNICRKMYRVFVHTTITPEIETDIIVPLAATFRNNNYELLPVYQQLFKSLHFCNEDGSSVDIIGTIVKSPAEVVIGMTRFFKVEPPDATTDYALHLNELIKWDKHTMEQGMQLMNPIEVAGWPAYHQAPNYARNWISANTIAQRFDFVDRFINGKQPLYGDMVMKLDIVAYVQDSVNISNPSDPNILIDELVDNLYPFGADETKKTALKLNLLNATDPDYYWTDAWYTFISDSDDGVVRPRLENLIRAILESGEYQLG